jgi:hypothetical protein
MTKYTPLQTFLQTSPNSHETLTFSQVERIIGFPLPSSASTHRPWWGNNVGTHTQAQAWLDAGWRVESVSLGHSVTFAKVGAKNIIPTTETQRSQIRVVSKKEAPPVTGAINTKNYIPVLCCSGGKTVNQFFYNGKQIKFVASPVNAPHNSALYCMPDDRIPNTGETWRDLVMKQEHDGLIPAYQLYWHEVYRKLFRVYGERFYIFSAGWGIVRSTFKLPCYDITFSNAPGVEIWAKRTPAMRWNDFNHLKEDAACFDGNAKIILFAGTGYVEPFCRMTSGIANTKIITHKAANPARYSGFEYCHCNTKAVTNWFYEAVENFLIPGCVLCR